MKDILRIGWFASELAEIVGYTLWTAVDPICCHKKIKGKYSPNQRAVHLKKKANKKIHDKIELISWNIFRNYSKRGVKHSLKKLLKKTDSEILLLQESPVYKNKAFWDDPLFDDFHVFYAPAYQVKKRSFLFNFEHAGQLILSRVPFTKTETYELPHVTRKPIFAKGLIEKRIATYAQITTSKDKTVGLYNVHLELGTNRQGRRQQVEYMLEKIQKNADDVVIIGGDFNTVWGGYEQLFKRFRKAGFKKVFKKSNFWVRPRLDYFFVRGAKAKGFDHYVGGSDHYPIRTKVEL